MDDGGTTWIVAADGAQARAFEERRRAGEVREVPGWGPRIEDQDRPNGREHRATVHERGGPGRHADGDSADAQEAESRFLKRVAAELGRAEHRHAFDHLVILAPPRALGVLRQALPTPVQARLAGSDPHECVREDADQIRERLRGVRTHA